MRAEKQKDDGLGDAALSKVLRTALRVNNEGLKRSRGRGRASRSGGRGRASRGRGRGEASGSGGYVLYVMGP